MDCSAEIFNFVTMRYLLILTTLLFVLFFALPDFVLYSKIGFYRWFPFVIIFLAIPFLSYKTLTDFKIKKNVSVITASSALLIGPLFGIWTKVISDKDLEQNGQTKMGIVSEKWYANKRKGEWLYSVKFKVENVIYHTFSNVNKDNRIKIGDTVLVQYSKRNPENNKILK